MKRITLTIAAAFSILLAAAQDNIPICHTSPTERFAYFASNKEFVAKHPNPRPYIYRGQAGKMITFKTADGPDANAFFLPATEKTNKWIFVFQEWWGLNDNIKREAEKLWNDVGDVNVLALDMYDGKVATDAQTAAQYMQTFKQERGTAIVQGAMDFAGSDAQIATIGWCFGGGQSMQAALTAGKQAVACVMYYGMPEDDVNRLKTLNCDVLDIWGTQDKFINAQVTQRFQDNMKAAGKKITVYGYDADHAFANPSNPKYNAQYTAEAYQHTLEFLKARI